MNDEKEPWEIGYTAENPAERKAPSIGASTFTDFTAPDALVGQTLDGRFLIDKNLTDDGADEGGIGLVYKARDLKLLGRDVVVKILQKEARASDDIVRKFQHEREALIRLEHPNIVRILDSGMLRDGNPFTVMEFIPGYSLRRKINESELLPFEYIAHITDSVTRALAFAHSAGVLHRDIKPENIMLTPQDGDAYERVRLIDFGIARVFDSKLADATTIERGIGTPKYIAPEQLTGSAHQTGTADIYSFATVVFEMLTGSLPFKPTTIYEVLELQKKGVQTPPSQMRADLPPAAEKLLLSALEFDAEKRPQNALNFGKDLVVALTSTPAAVLPPIERTAHVGRVGFEAPSVVTPAAFKKGRFDAAPGPIDLPHLAEQPNEQRNLSRPILWAALVLLLLALVAIPMSIALWHKADPAPAAGNANSATTDGSARRSVSPTPANSDANTVANSNVNSNANTPATSVGTPHELTYFLNVMKKTGPNAWSPPYASTGEEVFGDGDRLEMVFKPDAAGYFYLFNEGNDKDGRVGYNLLFPSTAGADAAQVVAGAEIKTTTGTFRGGSGTEIVWVIWTKNKPDSFEAARIDAARSKGAVQDSSLVIGLTKFFEAAKANQADVTRDQATKHTSVKANGDAVVHRMLLEHK